MTLIIKLMFIDAGLYKKIEMQPLNSISNPSKSISAIELPRCLIVVFIFLLVSVGSMRGAEIVKPSYCTETFLSARNFFTVAIPVLSEPVFACTVPVSLETAPVFARIAPILGKTAAVFIITRSVFARTAAVLIRITTWRMRTVRNQTGIAPGRTYIAPFFERTASMLTETEPILDRIPQMTPRGSPVSDDFRLTA